MTIVYWLTFSLRHWEAMVLRTTTQNPENGWNPNETEQARAIRENADTRPSPSRDAIARSDREADGVEARHTRY